MFPFRGSGCEWGPAFPLGRIYFSLPSVPPVGMGRDTGDIQHLYFTVKGAAQMRL